MTLREILGRLTAWRRRPALERELQADLEEHLTLLARDLEATGLSPADARAAARRKLGNLGLLKEESRAAWGFPFIETLLRDLRYAGRGLRRSPGFTLAAVVTLALGIGANAAMFGIIDRLMFRPHPYLRDPGSVRRVYIQTTYQGRRSTNTTFPYTRYLDLTRDLRTASAVAAFSEWRIAVGRGDESAERKVAAVSASMFGFFDAPPVRGRYFTAEEDQPPEGAMVAVLTHERWQADFGGDDVIGRTLRIGVRDVTIIGVAPPGFIGSAAGRRPDIFVPMTAVPHLLGFNSARTFATDYSWDWTEVLVRRAPGVSDEAMDTELTGAYIRSRAAARAINPRVLPDSLVRPRALVGAVKTAAGPEPGRETRVLLWVAGVAVIVLLIACASVANLQLARVIRRRRELTVRLALGAGRTRLVSQLVTESLLLSLLGAAAGILVAQWSGTAIRRLLLPEGSPFVLTEDARTIGVALGCALMTTLLIAFGPVRLARRSDLAGMMKGGEREGGARRSRLQTALLTVQVAFSVVLLVGASLFVKSFGNARAMPLGYDVRPVIEVTIDERDAGQDAAAFATMKRHLHAAAVALPGIEASVDVNSRLFGTNTTTLRVDGIDSVDALGRFNFQVAGAQYFRLMRTRILRGRGFEETDRLGAPLISVVSASMAEALWPGQDALGKCLYVAFGPPVAGARGPCREVVGIAENTAQQSLVDDPRFMYYMPVAQFEEWGTHTMLVRARGEDPTPYLEPLRQALTRAMPGDGFVVVRPLQEVVDAQMRSWEIGAMLFTALGGLAFVVAAVGLFGVVSYGVAGRSHELGVRVALGASARDVITLVVRDALALTFVGCAIGLLVARSAARWVQPLLFHQSATDPGVFVSVALVVLSVTLLASALPARRATRVDPMRALRAE